MADEIVALVQRFSERWAARDLAGALEFTHPEIEFDWSASIGPFRGIYRGHAGLTRFWTEMLMTWDHFRVDVEDAIDCGPGRLVTANVVRARGSASGIEIEGRAATLWEVRDGKILLGRLFQSTEEAVSAAALTEPAATGDNAEVIRHLIDHYRETGEIAAEYYDPEVVYTTHPDDPVQATYTGLAGVQRAWQSIEEAWESIDLEILELIEADDIVIAVFRIQLHGRGSGIDLEVEQAFAYAMRNGRIVRVEQHLSKQEALEAVARRQAESDEKVELERDARTRQPS